MFKTQCVLALLTLFVGLAQSYTWDIVAASFNRLEFYNEGKLQHKYASDDIHHIFINWITYDAFQNRVLFIFDSSETILSYEIATGKTEVVVQFDNLTMDFSVSCFAYDPPTGQLFATSESNLIYSIPLTPGPDNELMVKPSPVIDLDTKTKRFELAVDSCGGYLYWIRDGNNAIERARLDGSRDKQVLLKSSNMTRKSLTIDSLTSQRMYWVEYKRSGVPYFAKTDYYILSSDLNGKHCRIIHSEKDIDLLGQIIVSNEFIYWNDRPDKCIFWQILKNKTDVKEKAKKIPIEQSLTIFNSIAANYKIVDQTQGIPLCRPLKKLLPNYSAANDSKAFTIPVCHNYCLNGDCSVSTQGHPKCRCYGNHSGERCEQDLCQAYCLNDGDCSLNEDNKAVCQCPAGYEGDRCQVPLFLTRCSQTVAMLKDLLNTDHH